MGRNAPLRVTANVAVICLLSARPVTSTLLLPSGAMIQSPTGTSLILVSSRLLISSGGILHVCALTKATVC